MPVFVFFAALVAYILSASGADAGPVFFAVLSAGGGVAAAFGATTVGAFLTTTFTGRLLASVAVSALQAALAPKPKVPGLTTTQTMTGGTNPCGFVLGKSATAGDAVCPMMTHGKSGKTPNAYLTYVIALGDIPGQTLTRVAIDGAYVTLGATAHADYGLPVQGKYAGYAWVKYYDGSQTVADPGLLAKYSSYPERPWQADMIGHGVPYAICTFRYNRELFQGLPQMLFECGGIKLYDPRKDSTAGGSGAHRWGNSATYEASTNNAVLVYNIMRGITIPDLGIWGGTDIEAEDLPTANMFAAMNECDITVGTPAVAQYQAGYEVKVDMEPASVIEELLKGCTGQTAEVGGIFKMRVGGPGLPVLFITDDDIITSKPQDFDPFPQADQRKNGIDAQYPDPDTVWQAKSAPSLYNATWEAEDGSRRVASLDLPACPYPLQVQRVMASYSNDERRFRKHGLTLPPEAAVLEPLDAISWTSNRNGYVNKTFELSEVVDDLRTLMQRVAIREADSSDYSWYPGIAVVTETPSSVAVVPPAQTLTNWVATPLALPDASGVLRKPAIQLSWSGSELDGVAAIQYEVRLKNGAIVKIGDVADVGGGKIILAEGIIPATIYEARGKPVAFGWATDWTGWVEVTSPDIRLTSADLSTSLADTIANAYSIADAAQIQVALAQAQIDDLKARSRAALNGWLKDPTFADWTSGNLTAANWSARSGTGTIGTQFVGDFGGGIQIVASAGAASTYAYATNIAGLLGADPDAPYVVISALIEYLSGGLGGNLRVGWSNDGTTWTYATGVTTLAGYGIAARVGPHQYVERMFKRPVGTFAQIRLEVFFKAAGDGAQSHKWHLVNLRAASEAEILAGNVPTMQADISTIQTTATTLAGTVASQNTALSTSIGSVQATVVTNTAALVTLNSYAAATYTLRLGAGGVTAGLEIVAANNPISGPVSAIKLQSDFLNVTAKNVLFSGGAGSALNLDPNVSDVSAWSELAPANIVTISDGKTGATVLRGVAGAYASFASLKFSISTGKKYRLRATGRKSSTANGLSYVRVYWYSASGTQLSYTDMDPAGIAVTTGFAEFVKSGITPPANAVFASLWAIPNYTGTLGWHEWQGLILEEMIDASLVVDGAFAVTGMAIFGGNLQSSNYVAGVSGWMISSLGNAEFAQLVDRSWVKNNAVSDKIFTSYLGPFPSVPQATATHIVTLGIGPTLANEIRKYGFAYEFITNNGASYGLGVEIRFKYLGVWGAWIRKTTDPATTSWQSAGYSANLAGIYEDVEIRLVADRPSNLGPPATNCVKNVYVTCINLVK